MGGEVRKARPGVLAWVRLHMAASADALRLRWLLGRHRPVLPLHHALPCKSPPSPERVAIAFLASRRAVHYLCPLDTCLTRSIVFFRLLSHHEGVTIHFGFRRQSGAMSGHAWVCVNEEPFGETADPRSTFVETTELFVRTEAFLQP